MAIFDGLFKRNNTDYQIKRLEKLEQEITKIANNIDSNEKTTQHIVESFKNGKFKNTADRIRNKSISNEIIKFNTYARFFDESENISDYKEHIVDYCRLEKAYYFTESLLRRRLNIYLEKTLNDGLTIYGKNEKAVRYITKRINFNDIVSNTSFKDMIYGLMCDFIMYDFAVILLKRDEEYSLGYSWKLGMKEHKPIYTFERGDAPITYFSYKNGKYIGAMVNPELRSQYMPKNKRQYGSGTFPLYPNFFSKYSNLLNNFGNKTSNIIEIPIDNVLIQTAPKPVGMPYAIPSAAAFLEDIQLLRDAEETLREILFQLGFPLLHAKIGTDMFPMRENEDTSLQVKIQDMDKNSVLITDHRVQIDQIIQKANSVANEIEYLWKRVIVGLDLSDVALGIGSSTNKGTASITDKLTISVAKRYQELMSSLLLKLFDQFLFEAGLDPLELDDENRVRVIFPEIDIDKKILQENHVSQLFMQNLITQQEARELIQMDNRNFNINDTYAMLYGTATAGSLNQVSNATQPENQYGKKGSASSPTEN